MCSKHLPLSWVFLSSQQMAMWLLHARLIGQVQGLRVGSRGEGRSVRTLKQRGSTRVRMLSRGPPVLVCEKELMWLKSLHHPSLQPNTTAQTSGSAAALRSHSYEWY